MLFLKSALKEIKKKVTGINRKNLATACYSCLVYCSLALMVSLNY